MTGCWCARRHEGLVSAAGFEPTAPGFIPLRLSPPPAPVFDRWGRSWSGLSLHRGLFAGRCRPSSLYTVPGLSRRAWLGIGTARVG